MKELVTIIVNVYNGEKFIKKCLNRVVNQTYKNLEILIINDGSTDNTLNICQSYKDKRIRIINKKNMGLSLSRNVGIENAKGEYLYFVDVDDLIEIDVVEYLYNLCKKYDVKMSTCKPMDIYDYDFKIKDVKEEVNIISSKEMLKKILLSQDRAGTIWNKLISKDLFENIRFEDRIINDVTVTYKLCIVAEKIAYSNKEKYYYLRHSKSITGKRNEDRSIDLYKATIERYNNIKKIYPNFIENDIGLILILMHIYCSPGENLKRFLKEEKTVKFSRKIFSVKILTAKISTKEKIKILLFMMSPTIYKYIENKYEGTRYKYKM